MGFTKKDNIYKITRVTGNRDNILGISFDNRNSTENNIEVIEWNFPNGELITATKYKESTFQNFILTKNLGTLN